MQKPKPKDLDDQALKNAAIRLLCRREHSREELFSKLSSRASSSTQLVTLLDQLSSEGLQSDDRFTESYVRSRLNKGVGPLKIAYELKSKKIDSYLVEKWLSDIDEKAYVVALTLAERKLAFNVDKSDEQMVKVFQYLRNKGFHLDMIKRVFSDLKSD